ncbi:proline dehydrogenase family protein [Micromonospora sp. R77]|uniref:proline dehydrogenase family protein n=1 Tax=Micromonospora sp. R77 TaxID=2925836 RepID=UPI001F601E60|nr:proline dehydrogenase family protein [Micromonospora sp. R77]MCI4066897.1 proline dehydrogenase family protein [Micromonospora sp. R77]
MTDRQTYTEGREPQVDDRERRSATAALKGLAAGLPYRTAFAESALLRDTLWPAASRYIVARDRAGLLERLPILADAGYGIGVEVVGEEVRDVAEIAAIVAEYQALITESDRVLRRPLQLGFDLSSMGSLQSRQLAYDNTAVLLEAAAGKGIDIIISMENSGFVDGILDVFRRLAANYDNVGLTLQAHLHRTAEDIESLAGVGAKIRLVKGVYRESPEVALPRGPELDERYVTLLERLLDLQGRVTCASQDPVIHDLAGRSGLLKRVEEVEMLHGVRPDLLRGLRDQGIPVRVAAVYGENWWLHFLHRLAEYPPNVLTALADLADPGRIEFARDYR